MEPAPQTQVPPTGPQNALLGDAQVQDALLLIDYANKRGVEIPDELLQHVVCARSALNEGKLSDAIAANFLSSASKIAKLVLPVTLESIRFTSGTDPRGYSQAGILANRYNRIGLICFSILFFTQVYWFILDGLFANLKQTQEQLSPYVVHETITFYNLKKKLTRSPTDEEFIEELTDFYYQQAVQELAPNDDTSSGAKKRRFLTYKDRDFQKTSQRSYLDALGRFVGWAAWLKYPGRSSLTTVIQIDNVRDPARSDEEVVHLFNIRIVDVKHIQTAQNILDSFTRYFLPILYGLMGASLYVVRRASAEIRDATLTERARIDFNARLFLGAFAGLAIAWFVGPSAEVAAEAAGSVTKTIANLSPLALSFVAGYAVEILFFIVDRFVAAFSDARVVSRT